MPFCSLLRFCTCLLLLSGCATGPQHPALLDAELAPLLPVRAFVANTDHKSGYRVSPDGTQLMWTGVSRLRPALLWRALDGSGKTHAKRFKKSAPYAFWAADSRHILYHQDDSGREQSHVFALDTRDGSVRDLSPFDGVTAWVAKVPESASDTLFIAHNGRDASVFDTYRADLKTAELTRIFSNTENISHQLLDDNGAALVRVMRDGQRRRVQLPDGEHWRELFSYSRFETFYPIQINEPGKSAYAYSNRNRDRIALVSFDLRSGDETVVYQHPNVDISAVWGAPGSQPLAVTSEDGLPSVHYLSDDLKRRFAPLHQLQPSGLSLHSLSRDLSVGTVLQYDHSGGRDYLIRSGELELLSQSPSRKHAELWARPEAFKIAARDGLMINGYITRPPHTEAATPTVLHVHGGPWARDYWGHKDQIQFLVNRGYTVLQVNYRGSTGYGRAYRDAARDEFAGKMHTDLLDALDWAIEQGYTDPDKVGIMGGSYGGYATLVGMTMTPERFACGVDIVGVSDLATLLEDAPAHWGPEMDFWYSFVGDPRKPTDREAMNARSPLYHAENADPNKPLLIVHGRNDPRVNVDQSDRMVAALEKAGVPVQYATVANEGHGFAHWKNKLRFYRQVEDFFAQCLGGRSAGFDLYQLGSWAF